MTETSNALPSIIVVADGAVHHVLTSSGAQWHTHHPVGSVEQLWNDLDSGALSDQSIAVVIADTIPDRARSIDAAATMAPYAATFVLLRDLAAQTAVDTAIRGKMAEFAAANPDLPADAPVHYVQYTTGRGLLDAMRHALGTQVAFPADWAGPVDLPLPGAPTAAAPATPAQPAPPSVAPTVTAAPVAPVAAAAPTVAPTMPTVGTVPNVAAMPPVAAAHAPAGPAGAPRPGQVTITVTSSKGGSGKCLAGDSMVMDPVTGAVNRIDDVVAGESTQVVAFDGRMMTVHDIADRIPNGVKDTFTVTLRSGRQITATANHPLLTTDGWRALDSLEVGETIATPSRLPMPTDPVELPDAEVDLLAVLLAEGSTAGNGTGYTSFDPTIIAIVEEAAHQLGITHRQGRDATRGFYRLGGGVDVSGSIPTGECRCGCGQATQPSRQKRGTLLAGELQPYTAPHSTPDNTLRRLRRVHGLDRTLAKHKTMPAAVYGLPEEQLTRLLTLFWMCDGYATTAGGGDCGITLASRDLIVGFQHLLLRLGVNSKVGHRIAKSEGREFDAWRLSVYTASLPTLAAKLSLWGDKGRNLTVLAERAATAGNPNVGSPTFSDDLYRQMVTHFNPTIGRGIVDRLGWDLQSASPSMVLTHRATKRSGRKHLNLAGVAAFAELTGTHTEFGWIADSELFWDEIDSISPAGSQPVYDIEVPGPHNFVANDVVVHNSTSAIMLATTIAHASEAAGKPLKVALVDMDTRDGQIGSLIGKWLPTALNVRQEPVINSDTVTKHMVYDPKLKIHALLAPVRPRTADDVGPDFYRHVIRILKTEYDVVVLDTSVNYLDALIATVCLPEASAILFVTTMASTAVHGMARALREVIEPVEEGGMGIPKGKIGIVVNQAVSGVGMETKQVFQAAMSVRIVGSIPMASKDVLTATNKNQLHRLLEHPNLAPAYYSLASMVLPQAQLAPSSEAMSRQLNSNLAQSDTPPAASVAQQPMAAAGQPVPAGVGQEKKKGLFRR